MTTAIETKRCARCGEDRPTDQFYAAKTTRDRLDTWCRSCRSAYQKENRERYREHSYAWRKRNPEKAKASRVRFLDTHREHLHDYERRRYEQNREVMLARNANWRRDHRFLIAARDGERRAIKRGLTADKVDYESIVERDAWACHVCGGHVDLTTLSFDHVIPIAKGGPHTYENVKVAHQSCNYRKHTKLPEVSAA